VRRWAWITIGLYLLLLLGLTVPLYLAAFAWGPAQGRMSLAQVLGVYRAWGYWAWLAAAGAGQLLLLAVPVAKAEGRPEARRPLAGAALAAAALLAFVCVSALASLTAGVWGDKPFTNATMRSLPVLLLVSWAAWAAVFRRFAAGEPDALVERLTRWLLRGSILELLVAVPSHVIARRRNDCCAPVLTFWGIATGLTVMLLSFGPGVLFLFAQRLRRLKPGQE